MSTIKELGGSSAIKKDMKFKDKYNVNVKYHEITSNSFTHSFSNCMSWDVTTHYTNGMCNNYQWFEFQVDGGIFSEYELYVDESDIASYNVYKPVNKVCWHYNTKKVILFTSAYLLCLDCGADIRTLSEEEYFKAVKENI